jgi:hypothetical protein
MTVKKALQLTEWFLERNAELQKGHIDPEQPWREEDDIARKMTSVLAEMIEQDSKVIRAIRKELIGSCKHPKKMHDVCKGQKYCMACNMDL